MSNFTVITCSKNPAKLQTAFQCWGRGLSDLGTSDFPAIPVLNAPNIAQGYNDALAKVTTEFVIFSHDDAYPLMYSRHFCGKRLLERVSSCDVVGFAGSDKFTGASWQHTPTPYGQVINHPPLPEKMDDATLLGFTTGMRPCSVAVWGRPARLVRGIRTADGYCIAARTEAMRKLGGFWVPPSCPHFHYYDLDLFLRAFKSGLRTAIATDVYISHSSHGSYQQPEWAGGFEEFMDRWAGEADPGWGIQAVHGSYQGDCRICYTALTQAEQFMVDEVTVRESQGLAKVYVGVNEGITAPFPPPPEVVL